MVHRLLQLTGGGQGVDDGVDAKMAIAPEARGRDVIEGANTHEDSRRRVHRAFHPFVVSSGTERANHGSEPPLRGDGPGLLAGASRMPRGMCVPSGFSIASADTAAD